MTIASAFRGMTGALRTLLAHAVRWEQQRATRDGRVAFSFGWAEHRVVDQALLAAQVAPVEGHADEVAGRRLAVGGGANQSRGRAAP